MSTHLRVSTEGELRFETAASDSEVNQEISGLAKAVAGSPLARIGHGLLCLATARAEDVLEPSLVFGREIGRLYLAGLGACAGAERLIPAPDDRLDALLDSIPPLLGAEYATRETLEGAWRAVGQVVDGELKTLGCTVHEYLQSKNAAWHAVGRVTFHLAEQKRNELTPFAFLATYADGVAASGRVRHVPLGKALLTYKTDREQLLQLLRPVHEAARRSEFVKSLSDSNELYRPLAWTPQEAHAFLLAIPDCEAAGLAVRVPDWWKSKRSSRVQARAQIGAREPAGLGLDSVLSFDASLCLNGRKLTAKERQAVLEGSRGLRLIRGQWVEVDPDRLRDATWQLEAVAKLAGEDGLSFAEGMRLLAGATNQSEASQLEELATDDWVGIEAGPWLASLLSELRNPDGQACDPGAALHGTLRPYQRDGVAWLMLLARLGLGGCLADDMGLGKTIQVIALMLLFQREGEPGPHLLVLPASLLGNWQDELSRFGPSLRFAVAHRSECSREEMTQLGCASSLAQVDLVLTTYGTLTRLEWLRETDWSMVVLDEAQAIKNASTAQARAVKSLQSRMRFALTGTPVENHPGEIWSLFDFLCPGLLGSGAEFTKFTRGLLAEGGPGYGPLRRLLQPYILRRMKTDPAIAPDLPRKTQLTVHCSLAKGQVALYEEAVSELSDALENREGIERRGIVLAAILRLKQICNHPSQWTGDEEYAPKDSGKFARLAELCETIVARQEKLLVFTQFRGLTRPLANFLEELFGRPGLVLHGGTPVKRRTQLVADFKASDGPPFFVLSLKAGGTGLNLTAANHVIHFDRWWNPAVEDQATDRAFRIGQQRNVLVHAFSCLGTIEEKIDTMLQSKRQLAKELLVGGPEKALTEMDTDELLALVALDVQRAAN